VRGLVGVPGKDFDREVWSICFSKLAPCQTAQFEDFRGLAGVVRRRFRFIDKSVGWGPRIEGNESDHVVRAMAGSSTFA